MHLHKVEIETEPSTAPEAFVVHINELGFNQQIKLADVKAPEGVTLVTDLETLVVECSEQVEVEEETVEAVEGEEPEVIGRKKADEEEE